MPRSLVAAFTALASVAAACGGATEDSGVRAAPSAEQASEKTVDVSVYSGRPQPPPETTAVRVGAGVNLRLSGLGPPTAVIVGPDGAPVTTVDAPYKKDGSVVGTEQRFTPKAKGVYRVEYPAGAVIAVLDAS